MTKNYQYSTSSATPVYADSAKLQGIGKLFAGSSCRCVGRQDDLAIILYRINASGIFKVGFAEAALGTIKEV